MGMFDRYLHIHMVCAEPDNLLTKLIYDNVELLDVTYLDYLTAEFWIKKSQYANACNVLEKNHASYRIVGKHGVLWGIIGILRRPVLMVGILMFAFLSCIVPERIYFVRVTGNEKLPDALILTQAEACGITLGTKASVVRSEDVKNQLLGHLPQLQWLGITTSGTVATIHVKERSEPEQSLVQNNTVSSIVAKSDGIITQMTVYKGNPLFQVGQSVKVGDILVSGYTDCGLKMKAEHAQADVFAHTLRQIQLISPCPTVVRGEHTGEHVCFMLHIGKKVINLCNHSGISDTTCVKMYEEDYWTLPGNFQLPVSVIRVEHWFCESDGIETIEEEDYAWLPQFAKDHLRTQMIAGEILDEKLLWDLSDEGVWLSGNYACHELIGQVKYEEILEHNAEDNGTDSQRRTR